MKLTSLEKITSISIIILIVLAGIGAFQSYVYLKEGFEDGSDFNDKQNHSIPHFLEYSTDFEKPIWNNKNSSFNKFKLFTPPLIALNLKEKIFVYKESNEEEDLGLSLCVLKKKPYRFQFEGYVFKDVGNKDSVQLFLYDTVSRNGFKAKVGDYIKEGGIDILSFDLTQAPKITIKDRISDGPIVLTLNDVFFEKHQFILSFVSHDNSNLKWNCERVGDCFEYQENLYTVKLIDPANQRALLEKKSLVNQESIASIFELSLDRRSKL